MVLGLEDFAAKCRVGERRPMERTFGRGPERTYVQAGYRDFTVCPEPDRFPLIVFEMHGWVRRMCLKGDTIRN